MTENVKDFGAEDLSVLSMSAVHSDLFLTARLTGEEYRFVLGAMAENRGRLGRQGLGRDWRGRG